MMMWEGLAELDETAGLPIEPSGLTPTCRHCGDPYDLIDEDTNPRYGNLCAGCSEWFKDVDRQDELIIAHEDPPSDLRNG
jgi:hypothetical protein